MLNYRLSRKFKLLGNCEFNHLTIILTYIYIYIYRERERERERDGNVNDRDLLLVPSIGGGDKW